MMAVEHRSAAERREEIQKNARSLGIDDEFVSTLVDTFYDRIRKDHRLGPIFDDAIGDDWDHHLSIMKDFWTSVAMSAGRYSGKPVLKHQVLLDVVPEDFDIWLRLFEETLNDLAKTQGAVPYFMERAARIAESLKLTMFGTPGLPGSRW